MNMRSNYMYFELKYVRVEGEEPKKVINNANWLINQPHTNSDGVWGYLNMTERHGFSKKQHTIVDQYWVDFTKYKPQDNEMGKFIEMAFSKLN